MITPGGDPTGGFLLSRPGLDAEKICAKVVMNI